MKKSILLLIFILILTGCSVVEEAEIPLDSKVIMEGTEMETLAYYHNPDGDGKRFAIVGGIHGNETAGWTAAEEMVQDIVKTYPGASILFIPHANELSIQQGKRYGEGHEDLNRAFTGEGEDEMTLKLAEELKEVIIEFDPMLVIDHHESKNNYLNTDGKYQLGNTVIITDYEDNVMHLLFILDAINEEIVDDIPFILEANPPHGSFNRTMTDELGVFVATIETNRQLPLEKRVEEQKIVVNNILEYFAKE